MRRWPLRLGEPVIDLPALLGLADRTLAGNGKATAAERARNWKRYARRRRRNCAIRVAQPTANERLAAWQERWRTLLAELGRPETEEPAETETVLQIFADIEKEQPRATSLSERIVGMNARHRPLHRVGVGDFAAVARTDRRRRSVRRGARTRPAAGCRARP